MRFLSVMRPPSFRLAILALAVVPAAIATAQSAPPGAPPEGLTIHLQAGLPFSRFVLEGDEGTGTYGTLRGNNVQVRLSHHLVAATSAWLEVGSATRGSRFTESGVPAVDLRTTWWELGGGLNVALRCIGLVCPSLDGGAVLARNRTAVVRESSTGRLLGTIPITRYEGSAIAGVRLAVPRLRGLALTLRLQEGFTDLRGDLDGVTVRMRAQTIGIALPLGR